MSKIEIRKPVTRHDVNRFVGTTDLGKAIWNAALDDAAVRCDEVLECKAAARIRELKK